MQCQGSRVRSKAICLILALSAGLFACAEKDKIKAEPDGVETEVSEFSLADQWESACRPLRFDTFGVISAVERYDFSPTMTKTTTLSAAENCTEPVLEVRESGAFFLGGEAHDDARDLNLRLDTVHIKPLTANARNALNALRACDATDWLVAQEKDVTAKTGNPVETRCWQRTPREVFDIVRRSGEVIYLGSQDDALDKTSNETRPTTLDASNAFARK
ncbi:MAG: hypothetical protein NDI61_03080 [Bdellovibrionaceae bacterium]|nr:hypothetical protein [Pseudobdellovibrionaceae bacterium]